MRPEPRARGRPQMAVTRSRAFYFSSVVGGRKAECFRTQTLPSEGPG